MRAVLSTSREATVLISPDGMIEYASPSCESVLGYDGDSLLQRSIFELIHPDDQARIKTLFGQLVSQPGRTESGAFRFRLADGSWCRLEGTGTNHLEVRGVEAILGQFWRRDDPPAESGEHTFELVEEQLRILVENAVHITAIIASDGTIRYVSPAVQRMLGYTPDSLKRVHVSELVHPQDVSGVMAALERRFAQPGSGEFIQFRARHRDGSWRVLEAIANNRVNDPRIGGLVIDARDVTERNWSAERLRHSLEALLAIHDIGRILGSSSEEEAIERALLEGAQRVASIEAAMLLRRRAWGRLARSRAVGSAAVLDVARAARSTAVARHHALRSGEPQSFSVRTTDPEPLEMDGWAIPLRVQARVIGILELYGRRLADSADTAELTILADQAASALERARLYQAVAEREHRLEDLVRRLLLAQEEERRRVAYEIHDGLAQLAAASQQHLEAFAAHYRSRNPARRLDLNQSLGLASRTVREARRVIAGLRPSVLDDFGLGPALAFEVQNLRADGWEIDYSDGLGHVRLDARTENALFRVAQEALENVRKHAQTRRVAIQLERRDNWLRLDIRDWGRGFRARAAQAGAGPGERIGLAGMQERVALLSGRCFIRSQPGQGTRIRVEVPLRERASDTEQTPAR